jgi:hypothetical protein
MHEVGYRPMSAIETVADAQFTVMLALVTLFAQSTV